MKDIIVHSAIRRLIEEIDPNHKINIAGEYFTSLSKHLEDTIRKSCKRARENGRNTVLARDV